MAKREGIRKTFSNLFTRRGTNEEKQELTQPETSRSEGDAPIAYLSGNQSPARLQPTSEDFTPLHSQPVCSTCNDLSSTVRQQDGSLVSNTPSLGVLETSGELGCELCKLVQQAINDFCIVPSDDSIPAAPQAGSRGRVLINYEPGPGHGLVARCLDGHRVSNSQGTLAVELHQIADDAYRHVLPQIPIRRRIVDRSDSRESFAFVEEMLQECTLQHEAQESSEAREIPELPHRVLEVVTPEMVRVLETRGKRGRYLTLSHRWKQAKHMDALLQLTRSKLLRFQEWVPWSGLSALYQEAIRIAYELGFHYLWIDALCIIQDDPKDWAVESSDMARVYGNAEFTICAAVPGACFSSRLQGKEVKAYNVQMGGHQVTVHVRPEVKHVDTDFSNLLPNGEIFTRGWVLQEWLLSRRVVVFGASELLWFCDHGTACECRGYHTADNPSNSAVVPSTPSGITSRIDRQNVRERLTCLRTSTRHDEVHLWHEIARQYSRTQLTYRTDALAALSGLAKRFRQDYHEAYLAGCWRSHFPENLLWIENPVELSARDKVHIEFVAPTWSWLSCLNGVREFFSLPEAWEKDVALAELHDVSLELASSDPTGQLKDATLTIEAPALSVSLVPHSNYPRATTKRPGYNVFTSKHDRWLRRSERQYAERRSCVVLRARLKFGDMKNITYMEEGLVIEPSHRRPGCFERVGVLKTTISLLDQEGGCVVVFGATIPARERRRDMVTMDNVMKILTSAGGPKTAPWSLYAQAKMTRIDLV